MTSHEKVLNAEQQIRNVAAGKALVIQCPFCGDVTPFDTEPHSMCCMLMADVVAAVLNHIEFQEKVVPMLDKIAETVDKHGRN